MRLLLDTHIALWLATNRGMLSPSEVGAIQSADQLYISAISIWELKIKWMTLTSEGDPKGPADPRHVLAALEILDVTLLNLEHREAAALLQDIPVHRDPFDIQLLVEAQERQLRLLTRDEKLIGHPLVYALI